MLNVANNPFILGVIMLNVTNNSFMLSVIVLSVVMLSVALLNVIMLSVIMMSVIMLNVIMMSVVAPRPNMIERSSPDDYWKLFTIRLGFQYLIIVIAITDIFFINGLKLKI